jgi:hypothetical protein
LLLVTVATIRTLDLPLFSRNYANNTFLPTAIGSPAGLRAVLSA